MNKRDYIDSNINIEDSTKISDFIRMAKHLGFKAIVINMLEHNEGELSSQNDIGIYCRSDIIAESEWKAKKLLQKLRSKVDLLCLTCINRRISRLAARDGRVDLMYFPNPLLFDLKQARMASHKDKILEIRIRDILFSPKPLHRNLAEHQRMIALALQYNLPIIISSGAKHPFEMRAPKDLIALAQLLQLPEEKAIESITTIPMQRLKINREKLSKNFIYPGVKIVDQW